MEEVGVYPDNNNSPPLSPKTSGAGAGNDDSLADETINTASPNMNLRRSPRRHGFIAILDDGRRITIPEELLNELAVTNRIPSTSRFVIPVDAGFGCVELVVAGAKQNIYFIAHIKNAHALFPKTHLEEAMKDTPRESG